MGHSSRYLQRGVSSGKEDVHQAIKNVDKGLFPGAFCKVIPDMLTGDPDHCLVMHADGAGTKSSLAYIYWKETGDLSVWKGIAQDAIVMNLDDLLCVGVTGDILLSSTIGRNKSKIPGEVISAIINGTEEVLAELLVEVGDVVEAGDELARLDDSDRQDNLSDADRELRELTSASAIASVEKDLADTRVSLDTSNNNLIGLISLAVYRAEGYVDEYTLALAEAQTAADESPSEEADQLVNEAEQNLKWAESNYRVQMEYYENEYLPDNFNDYYWDDNVRVEFIDAPTEAEIASKRAEISGYEANIEELEILLNALVNDEDLPEDATGSQVSSLRQARQAVEIAQEDLEATTLTAPISGTVTAIYADESELVGNETLLVISDLTPPTLEAYFDDDLLKYGILPVQIFLCNKSHSCSVGFSVDSINLIDPSNARSPVMSCEQVLDKAKRSYWRYCKI